MSELISADTQPIAHAIPPAIPTEPVILYSDATDLQVEQARQTPQGRMHGVMVIPVEMRST